MLGSYNYQQQQQSHQWGGHPVDGLASAVGIVFFALIVELIWFCYKKKWPDYKLPPSNMSIDEFELRVRQGEELVILEDLVLNIEQYKYKHPGGKFSLVQNVGRDVSKFFYGGYALENEEIEPHLHSGIARSIVNSLIVA